MSINLRSMQWLWIPGFALVSIGGLGCTTDDEDPAADTTSTASTSSNTGSGGASSTASNTTDTSTSSTTGGTPGETKCASPDTIPSTAPGIADFDLYDGITDLSTWSFALGGDSATGVFAGPFRYGDEADGFPESFEAVDGHDSTYALQISDTLAEEYGGGIGLWLSNCVNASAFTGISFWVRGSAPTGEAKFSLLMEESTWTMAEAVGTCEAAEESLCVHPSAMVPVTDEWTEITLPWSAFAAGSTPAGSVTADGTNVWQLQIDVGLEWLPDEAGEYHPTPGPYEFAIDGITFY